MPFFPRWNIKKKNAPISFITSPYLGCKALSQEQIIYHASSWNTFAHRGELHKVIASIGPTHWCTIAAVQFVALPNACSCIHQYKYLPPMVQCTFEAGQYSCILFCAAMRKLRINTYPCLELYCAVRTQQWEWQVVHILLWAAVQSAWWHFQRNSRAFFRNPQQGHSSHIIIRKPWGPYEL